jgi:hypothetical protein
LRKSRNDKLVLDLEQSLTILEARTYTRKKIQGKKNINGSFGVVCGQGLHGHFGCKKPLAMMHDLNSMSLHCVSKKKSCCWTCYPWYNCQNHGKLHVLSTLKRWITRITLFDLWKSIFRFNTFALVINFINSNWVPSHVIVESFQVVDTSKVAMASQFQHLLELFFLWWHVHFWHFVLNNKILGFAMPLARLVNMFIITIKKLDFSKSSIWLKCPHWPKGMVILIKSLGHERHKLLLTETFD